MKRVLVAVLCSYLIGCSVDEHVRYPVEVAVRTAEAGSAVESLSFLSTGMIVGIGQQDSALVAFQGKVWQPVMTFDGHVLDGIPIFGGYLVAVQRRDSVYFLLWKGDLITDTLGVVRAGKGMFISSLAARNCLWLTEDGSAVSVGIRPKGAQLLGRIIVPSGATVRLADTVGNVIVLTEVAPHFTTWEEISIQTGGKRFSTIVPVHHAFCVPEQHRLVAISPQRTGYAVEWYTRNQQGAAVLSHIVPLPARLFEPQSIVSLGDTVIALFRSGFAIVTPEGVIGSFDSLFHNKLHHIRYAHRSGNTLMFGDRQMAVAIALTPNPWWWVEQNMPHAYRVLVGFAVLAVVFVLMRRLRRNKQLVRALLEKGGTGRLLVIDRRGRLQRLNSGARNLLTLEQSVPLGRPLAEYLDAQWTQLHQLIQQAIREQAGNVHELVIPANDGERRYLVSIEPIFTGINRFEGVLVSLLDVTAQYQQWQLIHWAQIAHDMQTNLATIRLNAEQLANAVPPSHEQHRRRILRQTRILLDRVRDLIVLGRGETLQLEECAIAALLNEVVAEVQESVFAQISFVVRPTQLVLRLDRRQMASAVRNALTNAAKAIGDMPGTIELWAELTAETVVIGIRDNGCGMDEDTLDRFLQPFFTTRKHGHGIGSMIMQRTIELHGGKLEVHSCAGSGTTVLFHLPRTLYVRHER